MSGLVHFPSDREGLTWCGLPFDPSEDYPLSGVDRDGLAYSTNMEDVTCLGCHGAEPTYPAAVDAAMRAQEPLIRRMLSDLGIDAMNGQRVAAERKAWARLVGAQHERDTGATCGPGFLRAQEELRAARQALRDLGVPVDALLEEA